MTGVPFLEMRWRYAQVTVGQKPWVQEDRVSERQTQAWRRLPGSKDMTDLGSRRGEMKDPERKEMEKRQRKQRDRSSGRSERRRTMRQLIEMGGDGDGRESTASWALGCLGKATLEALEHTKDEEVGMNNPMVLGCLLCATPGSRYLLIHAV